MLILYDFNKELIKMEIECLRRRIIVRISAIFFLLFRIYLFSLALRFLSQKTSEIIDLRFRSRRINSLIDVLNQARQVSLCLVLFDNFT